ncbi:hypothetical protein TTHERM_01111040 (macronuclear) [Tetrahymena thermophila SB210]|uniref:Uncharacterized protein n=1 Tax=Tetrahymena thermophila (strain SB210) TaxID=312017 RepID=Q24D50_TETTS|nr:hypothetical protein TTHERM_01111040 [Tetrahymena thermophila SB210]EAS05691.2 hypothetical protein TTHERM_01111040 [Tetrahymena thermophila SB210]|eukprot:XP_001025936.2 hypothetical protein TTHERM_01111040 [Tetrahymena thermophila SB210]
MLQNHNQMRSKSVGTSENFAKISQNTDKHSNSNFATSVSKNTPYSQGKSTFFGSTQSQYDNQNLRKDQLNIQISEFTPFVKQTEKSNVQTDSEELKYIVSPQKIGLAQVHQAIQMKTKRQCNLKSRVKSNDLSNYTNNQQIVIQNQSELFNAKKHRENESLNQKKLSQTKFNFNIKYFFKQPQEINDQKNVDKCLKDEQTPQKNHLFSTTSANLRYQKYNILSSQNRSQLKDLAIPFQQLNKQKISIPKCLLPIQQQNSQNILSQELQLKSSFEKNQIKQQKQNLISQELLNPTQKEEKINENKNVKHYFFNSFLLKRPKNNTNSKQEYNNLSLKAEKSSIVKNTFDEDEIKQQTQNVDISSDLFSKFKAKGSLFDIGQLDGQMSCLSKKSSNFSQTQENTELKTLNQVSFSQNNLQSDGSDIRSLSRLNLRKGQVSQESNISQNASQTAANTTKLRQLSLKDRLVTIAEQDTKQIEQISPNKYQIVVSPHTPVSTWQEKNLIPLESPSKRQNMPPSPLSQSPVSVRRRMYDLQAIDSVSFQVKDQQIGLGMQGIQNNQEQIINNSKDQQKQKTSYKLTKLKSQIETLIPLTLKRIVEKPFKQNIEVIKYGLSRSDPQGPKICINEFEIFQIFIRIIDHYDTAMKNENDTFRKMHSAQNQLLERLINKITSVQDAIKTIFNIKQGCSKISKIIYKLFEGISHLRFIFFEAEVLSPEKIALLEMQTKEDSVPPLINDTSSKILADRLFHNNFSFKDRELCEQLL